ncbi:MAG: hypothetical protein WCE54_01365 [Ignavibacteriaceae bacterium]
MKLVLPSNMFTRLMEKYLEPGLKTDLIFNPSSLITSEMMKYENCIGLIPTLDLLKNKELFVSKKHGIAFEGNLCNAYIYFKPGEKNVNEFSLLGDVSSLEVILSKILFKEIYNADIKIEILTREKKLQDKNLVVIGDKNFEDDRCFSGISFAEEVIEFLSLPFVNYVFASKNKNVLEEFNEKLENIGSKVYKNIEEYDFGEKMSKKTKDYIKTNISSFIMDFELMDIDGIDQLLRLPYYHGMVSDIIELKYV